MIVSEDLRRSVPLALSRKLPLPSGDNRLFREWRLGFVNGIGGGKWVWGARIALVLAAGLVLGRLGPFGTFNEIPPGPRFAYWIGLTSLLWLQSVAALAVIKAARPATGRIPLIVGAAIAGAVPTAFEVAWAEMLLRVERDLGLRDVLLIFGDVVILAVPLLLATHLLIRAQPDRESAPAPAAEINVDWLISQLRPDRRGKLLAVESEDHYVRVRTTAGDQLLYMRFGDAVARLCPSLGTRVHRSWWVARDAVRAQSRQGDRIIIELHDGTLVPVSRSYAIAARDAGLISGG